MKLYDKKLRLTTNQKERRMQYFPFRVIDNDISIIKFAAKRIHRNEKNSNISPLAHDGCRSMGTDKSFSRRDKLGRGGGEKHYAENAY
jgi:hypothetical protein